MRRSGTYLRGLAGVVALLSAFLSQSVDAQYFRRPVSVLDPNIMLIDEKAVLGAKIDAGTTLIDQNGRERRWGEFLGKPLILVLSYYSCDGSCSIINTELANLLAEVSTVIPGEDFRVITLSFDRHDSKDTTATFRSHLALSGSLADNWTFATFKSEAELKSETERIGFKFFWSPEDRVFLHPGAFLFFSPDGRLIRVLYHDDITPRDVELAVLDARQGQFRPAEIVKFALSLCYSYSYHDGRYVMSIPLIVGAGALIFGLATLFGSMILFNLTKRSKRTRGSEYAQSA
jgi:protein SCO1/2